MSVRVSEKLTYVQALKKCTLADKTKASDSRSPEEVEVETSDILDDPTVNYLILWFELQANLHGSSTKNSKEETKIR